MPQPTDPRIDAYIAKSAAFAQPILTHLRRLVRRAIPEVAEDIKWGMPTFLYRGKIFGSMAAFKAHATFGLWHQGMEKIIAQEIGQTSEAMGSLGRLTSAKDLPADATLLRLIRAARELHDSGAPMRAKPKSRAAPPMPPDLTAALKPRPGAAKNWAEFSPSAKREYIEWITEAKRPETRTNRLETTIEWVAEGKARNWKYESC
ncbi:MAG: hypothetical protein C0518_05170 [Opitutus sp.]|nr:hypothetical protein [Opitutus sp.]